MENNRVLVIAEAGVNHNGSLNMALKLVEEAKKAGADVVKFQTGIPEKVMSKYAPKAEYQKETTGSEGSQIDMAHKIFLDYDDFRKIKEHCKKVGIDFLSTPFETDAIDFLNALGCDYWKIPSGEITNYPYLIKIAQTHKPIILSTGMSDMEEIRDCVNLLKENDSGEITLLQCTTQYPTPYQDVNLRAMNSLKKEFNCKVGYSDHTQGIEVDIAAVALGACVIEKHFTLDKNLPGPDHRASLEPDELKKMVSSIRHIEKALGTGEKKPADSEIGNIIVARKSLVALKPIKKGEELTENNITTKRPGSGISPMKWNEIIGTRAIRDFDEDELIEV